MTDLIASPNPAWYQQTLPPNSLTFLKWYMLFVSLAVITMALVFQWQGYPLPGRLFWWAIPMQCVASLVIVLAFKPGRQLRTDFYLLLLLTSMLLLGWFLYDSGGHTNPLISILLLPVAMAAAILSWQASILMAICAIGIYTGLTEFYVPLESQLQGHANHQHFMQLHLLGMWLTFSLSALLLLLLVQPMAASIRKQKEQIAQQREDTLRDEQLIALATFAASAAHQMGTPLSTLALLVEDLKEFNANADTRQDLETMESQIQLCKSTLQEMMQKSEQIRNDSTATQSVGALLEQLQKLFTLLHPGLSLEIKQPNPELHSLQLTSNATLEQAILNLLDNAAKASNSNPVIAVELSQNQMALIIEDNGPGLPKNIEQDIGKPFLRAEAMVCDDKTAGMGLGLFLSNATINRLGGQLKMLSDGSGTRAEVWLPRTRIKEASSG